MSKKSTNNKAKAKAKRGRKAAGVRASYANARPAADNLAQFMEAWKGRGTTLQTLNHDARESLRTQARAEFENNQHAGGMARLFGLYVVGTGPRLRFKGSARWSALETSRALIDYVGFRWEKFADEIRFASTLRQAMQSIVVDGEAFLFVGANPKRSAGIDLKLIDAQRVGNPHGRKSSPTMQDGVFLDVWGNPEAYCVYNIPDNETTYYQKDKYETIGASQIFHLFREDLPGQSRGVSWFAAALPLFQQLREYTAAVIESAKRSARFVATIETQQGFGLDEFAERFALPGEEIGADEVGVLNYDAWGVRHSENGDTLILPPGTTQKAFDGSQPMAEASAFTSSILGQIGYSLGLPRNKATGSSHEYNFASGRLDNQPFELMIKTLQLDVFERRCCDRLFVDFYRMIEPEILERFPDAPDASAIDWEWVWPEPPLVDAESTARTNAIRLQSLQTTLGEVWQETHAFTNFEDVRGEIQKDARDFPEVFGVTSQTQAAPGNNTAINEPKGA